MLVNLAVIVSQRTPKKSNRVIAVAAPPTVTYFLSEKIISASNPERIRAALALTYGRDFLGELGSTPLVRIEYKNPAVLRECYCVVPLPADRRERNLMDQGTFASRDFRCCIRRIIFDNYDFRCPAKCRHAGFDIRRLVARRDNGRDRRPHWLAQSFSVFR